MATTNKKLIMIGVGGVGLCVLEMLQKTKLGNELLECIEEFIFFDMVDKSNHELVKNIDKKKVFHTIEITPNNIDTLLSAIEKNCIVVDVSYNIYYKPILERCANVGANYINTSVERWPLEDEYNVKSNFIKRTLHEMHKEVVEVKGSLLSNSPTMIMVHGMNPGLISHFCFLGLERVAEKILRNDDILYDKEGIKDSLEKKDWGKLAFLLKLRTVHCSEIDSQESERKCDEDEFVNTWGCYSFYSEGVDPVQIGFGTHEKIHEKVADMYIKSHHPDNQVYFPTRGIDLHSISAIPDVKYNGMLISHSENDTLSQRLSYSPTSNEVYRPSVYYVYKPCRLAFESIEKVKKNGYCMLPKKYCLTGHDIVSGSDSVGALLIFEDGSTFWAGTILSCENVRKMGILYSNSTVVQVGASLLSAMKMAMRKPNLGILFPEDLDKDEILNEAVPYLGTIFCDFLNIKLRPDLVYY